MKRLTPKAIIHVITVDLSIPNIQELGHINKAKLIGSFYVEPPNQTYTMPVSEINELTFWMSRMWVHIYEKDSFRSVHLLPT